MIAIDDNGNILANENGTIKEVSGNAAVIQNFISEVRCTQGTFALLSNLGRNPAVWYLSQSPIDRMDDLLRISKKYLTLRSIQYNEETAKFEVNI